MARPLYFVQPHMQNLASPSTRLWFVRMALAMALVLGVPLLASAAPGEGCLGFGSTTPGGQGGEVYHVTTLADSGPGSLREAVASGGRTVVFAVAGEIVLADHLYVEGAFVTIDGSSAPAPGITLRGGGLIIRGTRGAHDVIVESLRIRGSRIDGIQVGYGAFNVVISRVSITESFDGNVDVTEASDVTVCHSLLGSPASHNMLVRGSARVTLHDSLLVDALTGSPNAMQDADGTPAVATTLDMRHNFVRDWADGWGAAIHHGAAANVVENLFWSKNSPEADQANALIVCRGDCGPDPTSLARAYVAGNLSGDALGTAVNAEGTEPAPLPAPLIPTRHACTAARDVLDSAGAMPRDAIDTAYIAALTMPRACIGDLIVSALTAPASAAPGGTITIDDTVTNRGPGVIPESSTTVFYLSPTAGRDAAEIRLGQRTVPALAANETHTATTTLVIPTTVGSLGTYYVVAVADGSEALPEALEDNNVRARRISVGPDLIVDGVFAPDSAAPGDTITINVAVRNRGVGPIGASTMRVLLGTQTSVTGAVPLQVHEIPGIAAGATHTASIAVTIPVTAGTVGTYYMVAVADGGATTSELDENNNVRAARIMIGPDLVFDALTSPTTAVAGGSIVVTDTIRNRGSGPVRPTTTRFYLSPVTTVDTRAVAIGSRAVGRLAAGETSAASTTLAIPTSVGGPTPYYVIAVADAAQTTGELDTANNTKSARVAIGPDLVLDAVSAPNVAAPGATIEVGDTVRNRGVGPSSPSAVRYYLSTVPAVNEQAVMLGERAVPGLPVTVTHVGTMAVTIPPSAGTATGGTYYIVAVADGGGAIIESDETNNTRYTRVIIGPDLIIDALTGPATAAPGATLTLSWTVRNRGVGPAPSTVLRLHLSGTTTVGSPPSVLGEVTVPPVLPGTSTSGTATVGIPASAGSLGLGYVVAVANPDGAIGELLTTNNTRATRLGVGPDLTVDTIASPGGAFAPGASLTVEDVTRNRGIGPVGESVTTYYLSVSPTLGPGAVEVGSRLVPALAAGATHRGPAALTLPQNVGSAPAYYLIAKADGVDGITETNELNNVRALAIAIGPDLTVDSILTSGPLGPGASVTVEDVTRNRGIGPVGESMTIYYLSVLPTLGPEAVEVGRRQVPALAAGATHRGPATLTLPQNVGSAPTYYLIAKADGVDGIAETNELNNVRAITVPVGPDLVVDSIVTPPAALAGSLITVTETTRNRGVGSSPATATRFYISVRSVLDGLAIPLGRRDVPALLPGASHTATFQLLLPAHLGEAGSYYLLAIADGDASTSERDETNNLRAVRVAIGPDLIIDAVTVPAAVAGGATVALPDSVRNRGLGPSVASRLRFYLSTRKTYDPFLALPIGERGVPGLAAGARDNGVTHVSIPSEIVPGPYYVIGLIDDAEEAVETQEDNNGRYWPLTVQ